MMNHSQNSVIDALSEELNTFLSEVDENVDANDTIITLYDIFKHCNKCPQLSERKQVVFGDGELPADIMFVGQNPGTTEDKLGTPFVGASGKILSETIFDAKMLSGEVNIWITNIVKCKTPKNRPLRVQEILNCSDILDLEIKILRPRVIAPLGMFATQYFLGSETSHMAGVRGKKFQKQLGSIEYLVMPCYHPAGTIYNKNLKDKFTYDVRNIVREGNAVST